MSILTTKQLSIGYSKNSKTNAVQSGLNLQLKAGELVCLIGPNGSGKSTLLRTMGGLQQALLGQVLLDGHDLSTLTNLEKALRISLVLTERVEVENTTVYQIVALGRHPHNNWWGSLDVNSDSLVRKALKMVHLEHKVNSHLNELSDGERQRTMIAKALAQDTPIILLDEPTAHLDLPNRVEIMLLLHKLAHDTQKCILLSTHELDLALQAADRIWLMSTDQGVECGVPEDLVFNGSFNRAFQSNAFVFNAANGNFSMNYPMSKSVSVIGDKTRLYWTLRALARAGFSVKQDAEVIIEVTDNAWVIQDVSYQNIEALLVALNVKY